MRTGEATKTRILDAAEELLLTHGVAGTSIDRVLERAGTTKGAFFYHFETKDALLLALITRFADQDKDQLGQLLERASKLTSDPLQQLLVLVGLLIEELGKLTEPYRGCLYASFVYQHGLTSPPIVDVVRKAMERWRVVVAEKLRAAVKKHPPARAFDPETVADGLLTAIEGGIVLSKALNDPSLLATQLRHYQTYVELLFANGEKR